MELPVKHMVVYTAEMVVPHGSCILFV